MYETQEWKSALKIRFDRPISKKMREKLNALGYRRYGAAYLGRFNRKEVIELCEKWKASVNKVAKIQENTRNPTLCWTCVNSDKGDDSTCPWAREFKPVDGWSAKPTEVYVARSEDSGGRGKHDNSFLVEKCPLFERDSRRNVV